MRLKLTRLVLITCIALLGIIALQVFWLFKSYEEQREKLLAVVDNALVETQIFTGVNASLNTTVQSLAGNMLKDHLEADSKKGDTIVVPVAKTYRISVQPETISVNNPEETALELLKLIGLDSSEHKSYTIKEYKEKVKAVLQARNVTIPFELALVDMKGNIISATVDTPVFRKTEMKTNSVYSLPVTLNPRQTGRVQLAFPDAAFYLLRGMWVILALSLCLIIICAFSFSYMVALFYKQKKVAEIRNDFMNNMTHELKTPISSVSVALELLQDNSVTMDETVKQEYFRIAGNELNRLAGLVDKVLRMSALEKKAVKIRPEWFEVSPWVEEVLQAVKLLAEVSSSNVAIDVKPGSLKLFADRNQMSSILQNLLENAIKYADRNKPSLNIRVEAWEDIYKFYLKVSDNGIGIPDPYWSRIFDKFFRVPTGDQHETKGYGLGLSYVREITRLHKGEIGVESELKKGTTFTIMIPKGK